MKAGWATKPLGELCEVVNGGTPKSGVAAYWGGEVNWLTPRDMGQMRGRHIAETPRTISDDGLSNSSARLVPPCSVIMSTRAPIGHLAINDVPMAFNQGCRGMVPGRQLDPLYLFHFLSSKTKALNDLGTGATFKELSSSALKAFPIPIPPLEEQQRIAAVLDEAFEGLVRARAHAEANLRNAKELFASYLGEVLDADASNWPSTSIRSLVTEGVLFRPQDGNHGEIHPKKADFVPDGVPFIMASDLVEGRVDQTNCNFLRQEQADSLRVGFAKNGDVLLSHKGTIGRTALLRTELDYVMLTPQVTYYRVKDAKRLLPEFLYYAFQSARLQKQLCVAAQDGATRAYIGITKQLDIVLSIPQLSEQRRLVSLFEAAQQLLPKLIATYDRKIAGLDNLRQSLLQKAFAGELT